jgi:hypothetical protein
VAVRRARRRLVELIRDALILLTNYVMLEYMLIRPAERTLVGLATRELALAFEDGLKLLVEETGLGPTLCRARLRAVLEAGNAATLPSGEPVFAFRLHQFLASGGSVYATLEAPGARLLSTEGAGLRREGRRERAEAALSARLLPRVRAGELTPEGGITRTPLAGAIEGWLQPKPLMLCLRCRASYDLRETSDFRKLVTLSQTGRSTATTIVATAVVAGLRADQGVEAEARKLLSFTDNRQDAALQAGHMNHFVQVVLLRGALARALAEHRELRFDETCSGMCAR